LGGGDSLIRARLSGTMRLTLEETGVVANLCLGVIESLRFRHQFFPRGGTSRGDVRFTWFVFRGNDNGIQQSIARSATVCVCAGGVVDGVIGRTSFSV